MEVVMGRCFPLTGPGHQLGAEFPVVKGVMYKGEKTPDSLVSVNVNGNDNYSTRPLDGEASRHSEQGLGSGKVLSPHQNGVAHNLKQPATVEHVQRLSNKEREPSPPRMKEGTGNKKGHSNEKPKMQSILRRPYSISDPEGTDSSESLKAPNGKCEQDSGSERELSWGKRAWEITQRKKAQMREEFFKVPYEECNKEAARSLGGRLNKSEPRLHTLGKDRKKRNSLSYKRRVHFDLDYGEDEDDRKPRCRSKSFEAPDPPRKVVVSIYSIDKPKSVIQPDALFYYSAPDGSPPANTRTRNARPTDLDSLQQKAQTDEIERQQHPDNNEQPDTKTDKPTRLELNQRITPAIATQQTSSGRATTPVADASVGRSDNATTPEGLHNPPVRPPRDPSVRARHTPLSPLQSVPNNPVTPSPSYVASKTFSSSPEQPGPAPIPAPRSHLTKSHSLPGHSLLSSTSHSRETSQVSSQTLRPRPDHLNLNSTTSARAAVHVFTPTKTFIHQQEASPTRTDISAPRTQASTSTYVPTPPTATTLPTPATPSTSMASSTPTVSHITPASPSPSAPYTPTTPQSLTHFPNHCNGPVPMPRKRISVSQQTPTPQSSPHHHTHVSASHTPTTVSTQTSAPHTPRHTTHHTLRSTRDFQKTGCKKTNPNISSTSINKPQEFSTNTVPLQKHNKENDAAKQNQKTDIIERENSVNILMTKGESYAKHNIIISSHKSSAPPSVTVRKVYIPVSTPSRSSPSPTPSCASSSCSFGSSGSSSGCYSGSPSPTPTPSPTRIRASCAPTDL